MRTAINLSMRRRWTADMFKLLAALSPLADLAIVALSGVIAAYLVALFWNAQIWPLIDVYVLAILLVSCAAPVIFARFGLYQSWRGEYLAVELVRLSAAWIVIAIIAVTIGVLTKTNTFFSRLWMVLWFLSGLAGLWIARIQARWFLDWVRASGLDVRRVIVVGSGHSAQRAAEMILQNPWTGYRIVGYVAEGPASSGFLKECRYLGRSDQLVDALSRTRRHTDQLWIALEARPEKLLRTVLPVISELPIEIRIIPEISELVLLNLAVTHVGGLSLLQFNSNPITGAKRAVKAVEDRFLAAAILLVMAPVMVVIAVVIKLTSQGPVLFKQKRHGWLGERIDVYKFRTMIVHEEPEGRVTQARKGDARVTRFGAWLRRTSLDELPQFFNVLQGNMSVVGPRPHAIEHNQQYKKLVAGYMLRHKVKPGITGWAQINGYRGETDTVEKMRKRVEYDLYYIEHWSIWLDIVIVIMTLFRGFTSRRAY